MKTETRELIRIKKTKFVEMAYDTNNKSLYVEYFDHYGIKTFWVIPINKIPQVIRGLFSCLARFQRRKIK